MATPSMTGPSRDLTVALPMFYFMTIDELPCVFLYGLIVGAYKPDCRADVTVLVKDVRSILAHLRTPMPGNLPSTENTFCQFDSWLKPLRISF